MTSTLLRAAAAVIAIAGVVDPAVTSDRRVRPEIAVVGSHLGADQALIDRVATALDDDFVVVRGPFSGAAAVVSVGSGLPAHAGAFSSPAFAVRPAARGVSVVIEAVTAAARPHLNGRVPVTATVRVRGAAGSTLTVTARRGALPLDRTTLTLDGDDVRRDVRLSLPAPGAILDPAVSVIAEIDATAASARADVAIAARTARTRILFADGRPSWMSTFVRRAVAVDPRLEVTSRVGTSRNVAVITGEAPSGLGDAAALAGFDIIVVGAPDTLTPRDVSTLEALLRTRAATVVLLLDHEDSTPIVDRLTGARGWTPAIHDAAVTVATAGDVAADAAGALSATEIVVPRALPPGARPLAALPDGGAVVWEAAAGGGRVIVSGALDAWRFRDADEGAFDRFWRHVIGAAADTTIPPIGLVVSPNVVRPASLVKVQVTVRDVALDAAALSGLAGGVPALRVGNGPGAVLPRLARTLHPGRFETEFRAPSEPGVYVVHVEADSGRMTMPLVVAADAEPPQPDERALVNAWAASRGGRVVSDAALDELRSALDAALSPPTERVTWHPMRSPWWMVPFAVCLGFAWRRARSESS